MMRLSLTTLMVAEYDPAIMFFCGKLGFTLVEDTVLTPEKRWVVVAPTPGGAGFLLARAATPEQRQSIGRQTGGRVSFFLETDDLDRDRGAAEARGVVFETPTRTEPYGRVAVFRDLYGNRWDLIEPAPYSVAAG